MPEIDHELKIDATPERVYAALTTLDGVKGWHTPAASGTGEVGSEWVFPFADHPEFGWEITASDAPSQRRLAVHPRPGRLGRHHRDLHAQCDRRRSDAAGTAARRVARHARELPQVQHDVGRAPASPA